MKLSKTIKKYLSTKNKSTFCYCGQEQYHNLIYCQKCGKKFSDGYKPQTIGDLINWLNNKPNKDINYDINYISDLMLDNFKQETNDYFITKNDIINEIKNQLNNI